VETCIGLISPFEDGISDDKADLALPTKTSAFELAVQRHKRSEVR
jgi:hypothetical protein